MVRIPKSNPPTPNSLHRPASWKRTSTDIRHFGHELANQLTIINLCCGKIRSSLPKAIDASVAAEFDRIEKTVEECVQTLELIAQQNWPCDVPPRITPAKPTDAAVAATDNVYPLFEALEKSC